MAIVFCEFGYLIDRRWGYPHIEVIDIKNRLKELFQAANYRMCIQDLFLKRKNYW
ncbi:hypothetical protein ACYSNU_02150 [Enterococcus sp. LJL120]